ncbi:MAG TPA: hypothetical protein VJQ82_03020 [Terriglobales bacterium]|nr:hypothetical protein [Terriglobales bacterium]
MASDRGWYLIAVGVLALGLSNSMLNSHPDWLQTLTDRSVASAEHLSGQAERYLGMAQILLGRSQASFGPAHSMLGRMQADMGVMQADVARHHAEMARLEAANMAAISLPPLPAVRVSCPNIRVRVSQPVVVASSR